LLVTGSNRNVRVVALAAIVASGCLHDPDVYCADGRVCPAGLACDDAHSTRADGGCVNPDRIAACAGHADNDLCVAQGIDNGACQGGVCFEIACGNGFIEPGEVCEDGNTAPLDGCSADCKSTETCGNGYVDYDKGELCDDGNVLSHDGCDSRCRPEHPRWTDLGTSGVPDARWWYALAYDAARGRIVMFGGENLAQGYNDTWEWDGESWFARPAPSSPRVRFAHAMTYDAAHRNVVMFGGYGDNLIDVVVEENDTWLWDGSTWTQVLPAHSPPPRAWHSLAYDSARHRVVLFGGYLGANALNDTWEWDGVDWTQVAVATAPMTFRTYSLEAGHAMAFDATRGRMVLLLQGDGALVPASTWEYDGATWQLAAQSFAFGYVDIVYDAALGHVIGFLPTAGGVDGGTWFAWDGSSWQAISSTTAGPPLRFYIPIAYDSVRRRVVMFGGNTDPPDFDTINDDWEWDGSTWTQITPRADATPVGGAIAYDALRGRLVQFNGQTWELVGRAWQLQSPIHSPPLLSAMAYDALHGQTVLFGTDPTGTLTETWTWDGSDWTLLTPMHSPSARSGHAMTYDVRRGRVVLYGGSDSSGLLGDTWEWDGTDWQAVSPVTSPPPLSGHALAYDAIRTRVVLFGGGQSGPIYTADTWEWDGTTWTLAASTLSPSSRIDAGMTLDVARGRPVLLGGRFFDGFVFRPKTDTWEWEGTTWQLTAPALDLGQRFNGRSQSLGYDAVLSRVIFAGGGILGGLAPRAYRFDSSTPSETCLYGFDVDGDGLVGCADPDCWGYCTPLCPPGSTCDPSAPRCGDGTCSMLENCRLCPQDCGACPVTCGDYLCDLGEDHASCPGDCP
jgi:cysteine-rich repeat protein